MTIQVITENIGLNTDDTNITISKYVKPRAIDDFDINVIDLSYDKLWKEDDIILDKSVLRDNLVQLADMIEKSQKAKCLYIFPQDIDYSFNHVAMQNRNGKLKNLFSSGNFKMAELFPYREVPQIVFEPTTTIIQGKKYDADFHFEFPYEKCLSQSEKSCKITTIRFIKEIYATTLNVTQKMDDIIVLVNCFFAEKKEQLPEWLVDYDFGNDKEQKEIINDCKEKINQLQNKIDNAKEQLEENNRYKSILVSNGDELVNIVFEILEKLFNCDLSGFVDEKKEDFLIKKGDTIFIGEIKGVTSNIKSENVSQLDVHYQSYIEENMEISEDDVHSILIMNPFRNKHLDEREPVTDKQIKLAERNKSLIIETKTLLKIFELFQKEKITTEECIDVFSKKTGLLAIEDFNKIN